VSLFSDGDVFENPGDFRKTFLVGNLGETGIHFRCFIVFACRRRFEIFNRCADYPRRKGRLYFNFAALEKFKFSFCVFLFLVSGLGKNRRYLL